MLLKKSSYSCAFATKILHVHFPRKIPAGYFIFLENVQGALFFGTYTSKSINGDVASIECLSNFMAAKTATMLFRLISPVKQPITLDSNCRKMILKENKHIQQEHQYIDNKPQCSLKMWRGKFLIGCPLLEIIFLQTQNSQN